MKNKIRKAISISVIVLILFSFINITATVEAHAGGTIILPTDMTYIVDGTNINIDIDKIGDSPIEGSGAMTHNCYAGVGKCRGKSTQFFYRINSIASSPGGGAKTTVGSFYIYVDK